MSVLRLPHITNIGVEQMGDPADSLADPTVLRLENLDTDLRPRQWSIGALVRVATASELCFRRIPHQLLAIVKPRCYAVPIFQTFMQLGGERYDCY